MPSYDAIVVGAGVAGLAASRSLRRAGRRVLTLEARDRVGGRACTDLSTFSRPFDLGCHWLHGAATNPFTRMADEHGFTYAREVNDLGIYIGTTRLSLMEEETVRRFIRRTDGAIRAAGRAGGADVPVSAFIDATHPAARHYVAAFVAKNGVDPSRASALDWAGHTAIGDDRPVKQGYGDLIRRCLGDAPVTLSSPARSIDWSGRLVRVETPHGTAEASHALLTVSTGVMAAGAPRFTPPLPPWKQSAIEGLPMGSALKVGMEFSRDVFDAPETSAVSYLSRDGVTMEFEVRPFGWNGVVCYLDGDLARRLEHEGGRAGERIALEALRSIFGSAVEVSLVRARETRWETDPLTRGAYANALPGCAGARADLARAVGDRLFFAGEATAADCGGDAHGAYLSGLAAAEAILGSCGPA